jgi:hypothetical protein
MQSLTTRETKSRRLAIALKLALATLCVLIITSQLAAQKRSQKTFASPGEAVHAMISAATAGDTNQLMVIFGPQAKEILFSGDEVADKQARENVLEKYGQMNRLVTEPDESVTLYIGAENWPFPVPLVNKGGVWFFDTDAGKEEILLRRIGRNEFDTVDTLRALVDAQKEYASKQQEGEAVKQYAQKLMSDEGKHNGLYWKSSAGKPESPIGPLIAEAAAQGYSRKDGPVPFHGYIYRLLLRQGPNAPGGTMNYIVNGEMTRGFAILAYPVEYRNSGVMTFMVSKDGKIYQKDLGVKTAEIASSVTVYNPDKTWSLAE